MFSVMAMLACSVSSPAAPRPAQVQDTGFLFKTIRHKDVDHKYVVYVPREYDPARKWPTIVFLNGAGECGTDGLKQVSQGIGPAIMADAKRWPFIVILPQKPDVRQSWGEHAELVVSMLDAVAGMYSVDRSRVYLTGLSQGGHGTWVIGARYPERWAAIAPICGYGTPEEIAPHLKDMPVWCFHGEADTVVPPARSIAIVDALKALGASPKLTTYPGVGHNAWDKAYREEPLPTWFLEHAKTGGKP
jgi:predicted peptidase